MTHRSTCDQDVISVSDAISSANSTQTFPSLHSRPSLRRIPSLKNVAGQIQTTMLRSTSSREHVLQTWLIAGETPDNVFNILRLDDKAFVNNGFLRTGSDTSKSTALIGGLPDLMRSTC